MRVCDDALLHVKASRSAWREEIHYAWSMDTKICFQCDGTFPVTDFYERATRCKPCIRANNKARYHANPEKYKVANAARNAANPDKARAYRKKWYDNNREVMRRLTRNNWLLTKYGITIDTYESMLEAQGGRCAACGSNETGWKWDSFHVDHCHDTGRVRGLLCQGCNVALGNVGDSIERLKMLVTYLERSG